MKVYDKAAWHIDGGENPSAVIVRFKSIFSFLAKKKLLSADGKEILDFGVDSSVSLNSSLVNKKGEDFLDRYYDIIISQDPKKINHNLLNAYNQFKEGNLH